MSKWDDLSRKLHEASVYTKANACQIKFNFHGVVVKVNAKSDCGQIFVKVKNLCKEEKHGEAGPCEKSETLLKIEKRMEQRKAKPQRLVRARRM